MNSQELSHLSERMKALTPVLVDDVLVSFQSDPVLVARYGDNLRSVAEQGVITFREIVLGALEFDAPSIVTRQLDWLDRLLQARQIESTKVSFFLALFRRRINTDLSQAESVPLLALIEKVQARLKSAQADN